ncbi:hypothetical protein BDV95DRAFT_609358 [Massariosphaeria phaeospora]|uniref:Uncharacterized protein n=1 Tax=Massariosphaeria phaeospora TaxID=100035 RepID=A0A7C8M5E3_9PLEO|nr:hypothetical protein BDV95DRAFT_609358 [Massariosphaeria phaeospora]
MATISKQYTRLLSLWPHDALRPNLPFTKTIEYRALPHGVQPLSPSTAHQPSSPAQSDVQPAAAPPPTPHARVEQANINALFALLENRYAKKYPMSAELLKPASNPEHYENLMREIERAPTKTWVQAKLDEWRMKIRWS